MQMVRTHFYRSHFWRSGHSRKFQLPLCPQAWQAHPSKEQSEEEEGEGQLGRENQTGRSTHLTRRMANSKQQHRWQWDNSTGMRITPPKKTSKNVQSIPQNHPNDTPKLTRSCRVPYGCWWGLGSPNSRLGDGGAPHLGLSAVAGHVALPAVGDEGSGLRAIWSPTGRCWQRPCSVRSDARSPERSEHCS